MARVGCSPSCSSLPRVTFKPLLCSMDWDLTLTLISLASLGRISYTASYHVCYLEGIFHFPSYQFVDNPQTSSSSVTIISPKLFRETRMRCCFAHEKDPSLRNWCRSIFVYTGKQKVSRNTLYNTDQYLLWEGWPPFPFEVLQVECGFVPCFLVLLGVRTGAWHLQSTFTSFYPRDVTHKTLGTFLWPFAALDSDKISSEYLIQCM